MSALPPPSTDASAASTGAASPALADVDLDAALTPEERALLYHTPFFALGRALVVGALCFLACLGGVRLWSSYHARAREQAALERAFATLARGAAQATPGGVQDGLRDWQARREEMERVRAVRPVRLRVAARTAGHALVTRAATLLTRPPDLDPADAVALARAVARAAADTVLRPLPPHVLATWAVGRAAVVDATTRAILELGRAEAGPADLTRAIALAAPVADLVEPDQRGEYVRAQASLRARLSAMRANVLRAAGAPGADAPDGADATAGAPARVRFGQAAAEAFARAGLGAVTVRAEGPDATVLTLAAPRSAAELEQTVRATSGLLVRLLALGFTAIEVRGADGARTLPLRNGAAPRRPDAPTVPTRDTTTMPFLP